MKRTDYYIIHKSPAEGACEKTVEESWRNTVFSSLDSFPHCASCVSVLTASLLKHGDLKKQEIRGRWKNNYDNTSAEDTENYLYICTYMDVCVFTGQRTKSGTEADTPDGAVPFSLWHSYLQ